MDRVPAERLQFLRRHLQIPTAWRLSTDACSARADGTIAVCFTDNARLPVLPATNYVGAVFSSSGQLTEYSLLDIVKTPKTHTGTLTAHDALLLATFCEDKYDELVGIPPLAAQKCFAARQSSFEGTCDTQIQTQPAWQVFFEPEIRKGLGRRVDRHGVAVDATTGEFITNFGL